MEAVKWGPFVMIAEQQPRLRPLSAGAAVQNCRMTARVCALALSLSCGLAAADGIPILTDVVELPADDATVQQWKQDQSNVQRVFSVKFDKRAFGANVLTMELDGKDLRFVGSMRPPSRVAEVWSGRADTPPSDSVILTLTKDKQTSRVGGMLLMQGYAYVILSSGNRTLMIEAGPGRRMVVPSEIDGAGRPASGPMR